MKNSIINPVAAQDLSKPWIVRDPNSIHHLETLLLPLGIAIGCSLLLLVVRRLLISYVNKRLQKRNSQLQSFVIPALAGPSIYLCFAVGLYLGVGLSDLQDKLATPLLQATHAIVILSLALALANLSVILFKIFVQHTSSPLPTSGLVIGILKGSVLVLGAMVTLSVLGISIAPLLTALGVGGLAIALALKDTLENLFAGIYLLTDQAIRVGDVIRLEWGQEGLVEDIGWRTTRIRLSSYNTVILPNSRLAQSIVTNFNLPEKKLVTSFPVSVTYGTDPRKVEEILVRAVKRGSEDIVGLLASPEPVVRFAPGFGDQSLDFTLYFYVRDYDAQGFAKHELRKRVYQEFVDKGVLFAQKWPMPARAQET